METINCMVVDDIEIDRILVEEYVRLFPFLNLVGCYKNAVECLEVVQKLNVKLLFLDIDMPVVSGLEFFKSIQNPPLVIFITAYPGYAPEAFDVYAIDFLMKPVKIERFEHAVNRVKELLDIQKKALRYDLEIGSEVLTIKEGYSVNKILINDIIYLEALTNYTKIYTKEKKFITLKNLKNLLAELPADKFVRVHRSYAVASGRISKIENSEVVAGECRIPLGKTYKPIITKEIRKFGQFTIKYQVL